jgi:nicotinate-nucleotide pyrophosphorylase (carboxylating)
MTPTYLTTDRIHLFIDMALQEDVGEGDFSSLASIPSTAEQKGKLLIKAEGILAGVELAQTIFHRIDPDLRFERLLMDGDRVMKGDIAFEIEGKVHSILKGERLVLNCMQRMSGVASYTHHLRSIIQHTQAKLLDTRKTTPNARIIEKWAVAIGGGINHRFGLFDMIMLKDNHVDAAGGVKKAILAASAYLKNNNKSLAIEIEVRTIDELKEVLEVGNVNRIMLDNMTVAQLKEAVELVGSRYELEASGGITRSTIKDVAETGVNYISVGVLTHSYKSMDMSLKLT